MSAFVSSFSAVLTALDTVLHYYTQYELLMCAEHQISIQSFQLSQHIKSHLIAIQYTLVTQGWVMRFGGRLGAAWHRQGGWVTRFRGGLGNESTPPPMGVNRGSFGRPRRALQDAPFGIGEKLRGCDRWGRSGLGRPKDDGGCQARQAAKARSRDTADPECPTSDAAWTTDQKTRSVPQYLQATLQLR